MLVKGKWSKKWDPYQKAGENGDFIRQTSSFRNWVTEDGSAGKTGVGGFQTAVGRYHLYIALICPWACRTLMTLQLKGLEHVIGVSIVTPCLTDEGWKFASKAQPYDGATEDPINGYQFIYQLYSHADPQVTGRATVPLLWDKQQHTIVNNESADIIQMLNSVFNQWAKNDIDLRPAHCLEQMDALSDVIYQQVNNGVYRAGFAQSQGAYKQAVNELFDGLSQLELRLQDSRFLFGSDLTEADVRLFVTLIRFDVAYHGLFKCNIKRIADYPALYRYMQEVYAYPTVASSVDIEHIKQGYYSVAALNPNSIVPVGPVMKWLEG